MCRQVSSHVALWRDTNRNSTRVIYQPILNENKCRRYVPIFQMLPTKGIIIALLLMLFSLIPLISNSSCEVVIVLLYVEVRLFYYPIVIVQVTFLYIIDDCLINTKRDYHCLIRL